MTNGSNNIITSKHQKVKRQTVVPKIIKSKGGNFLEKDRNIESSIFNRLPDISLKGNYKNINQNEKDFFMIGSDKFGKNDKPKILLVEDNFLNRLVTKLYLKDFYIIEETDDGTSAISLASNRHYDIILMDINLGLGIDGIETMHRIRKLPGYREVPIIAVTAYAMFGDKERFLNEGFTEYIAKPFVKDSFISVVNNSLNESLN